MYQLLHVGKCKYYLQQVDRNIKTIGMTDKVAKGFWYKTSGGLSVWQVRAASNPCSKLFFQRMF